MGKLQSYWGDLAQTHSADELLSVDVLLVLSSVLILALGLLMVGSASMPVADELSGQPFFYLQRQLLAVALGIGCAFVVFLLPMAFWSRIGLWALLAMLVLLVLVLIPGIGKEVNRSWRWLPIGGINLQVSELAKLCALIYLAQFLQRYANSASWSMKDILGPMVLMVVMALLLLLEPDYGAAAVLVAVTFGMMFLAGIKLWHFSLMSLFAVSVMGALAYLAPYRFARLSCFLNPWDERLDCGYQLTQSLIAIGRGGVWGVGLGGSIQKLHYLPEAHNDFLFAILAEELGLVGVLTVLVLYSILIWRCFQIGANAERIGRMFAAYLAYGIGLLLALQVLINMGVNMGVLPTKGLTLPLMSYGRSSMVSVCLAIALVLRIDWESRYFDPGSRRNRRRRRTNRAADAGSGS